MVDCQTIAHLFLQLLQTGFDLLLLLLDPLHIPDLFVGGIGSELHAVNRQDLKVHQCIIRGKKATFCDFSGMIFSFFLTASGMVSSTTIG